MMKKWEGFLRIPEGDRGDFAIRHTVHPPGKALHTANIRCALIGGQRSTTLVYDRATTWHSLLEDNGVWMTDLPCEQAQADRLARGIHGRVLVTGLGLGYVAQRLALRRNVERVTVVEKERDVIELVANHLRGRKKIHIVEADAFEFVDNSVERYDFAYHDIWQSDGEGTFFDVVVVLREMTARLVPHANGNVRCWNEDVMRGQLRNGIVSRLTMVLNPGAYSMGVPTLDEMCEPTGNKYHDWTVEFFRWVRNYDTSGSNAVGEATFYANVYGLPR